MSLLDYLRSFLGEDAKKPQPGLPFAPDPKGKDLEGKPHEDPTPHSAGCVIVEPGDYGKVWIRKSKANPGYPSEYSFPKGRIDKGETPMEAALRETEEEVGIVAKLLGTTPIGTFKGTATKTTYYLAKRLSGPNAASWKDNGETEKVVLVPWAEAVQLFHKYGNKRDPQVVKAVLPRVAELMGVEPESLVKDASFEGPNKYVRGLQTSIKYTRQSIVELTRTIEGFKTEDKELRTALDTLTTALKATDSAAASVLRVLFKP